MINKQMATQTARRGIQANKKRPLSKREKAHLYASGIKKPETMIRDMFGASVVSSGNDGNNENNYGGQAPTYEDISPLDAMELEHEKNRYDVEAIRRGYGI
jgi:hypothetical protein